MSENRIDIEEADNGWTVKVWKEKSKDDEECCDTFYREPEKLVATSKEEVIKIVTDNL